MLESELYEGVSCVNLDGAYSELKEMKTAIPQVVCWDSYSIYCM